ncbi:MAG TPA: trypsin-like peptidase domain-containing protein, partial [Acidobacteriota bacterium]|nr:trypsin-like peptidase domain-containing protein [Acidobacteriota bacterium]
MKKILGLFLLLGFAGTAVAQESLTRLSVSFEELAEKVSPAVVQILVTGYGSESEGASGQSLLMNRRYSGSGVIVDSEGYIVTNAHVVADARRVRVLLAFGDERETHKSILKAHGRVVDAKLVGLDTETDLAVLKIQEPSAPHLELADSDSLKPGQIVLAFGSPLGLDNSVSMGVISAVARQLKPEDPMIYIQTDATINPGNSGGPLIDTQGKVVGINTSIYSYSGGNEGIGFAAPSNIVRNVLQQIRKTGTVRRGEIGVHAQTITPTLAAALSLPQDWGVILGDVTPGSSAERAGLMVGDIVLTLDGKVMENGRQFDVNIYRRADQESATLEVLRSGERLTIPVAVTLRQDDPTGLAGRFALEKNAVPRLGVFVLEMNDEVAQMIPGLRKQYGLVVVARMTDAPYWASQFQPGDVIHALN